MRIPQLATILMLFAILTSACGETIMAPTATQVPPSLSTATPLAPSGTNPGPFNNDQSSPLPTPLSDYPVAVQKAVKSLAARSGISENQIVVISYESVEWPDNCLGVNQPGIMCAMIVTQGYRVILQGNGSRYEYHTNGNGSVVVLFGGTGPASTQPGSSQVKPGLSGPVFSWRSEGGIAGLCSSLTITADGDVSASSCVGGKTRLLGQGKLTSLELSQLTQWIRQYQSFEISLQNGVESSHTPVPDSIATRITFTGLGSQTPLDTARQVMIHFAEAIFTRVARSG